MPISIPTLALARRYTNKKIQDIQTESGNLPSVTASDNGKALIVQNGSWMTDVIDHGYSGSESDVLAYDLTFTSGASQTIDKQLRDDPLIVILDDGSPVEIPYTTSMSISYYGTQDDYSVYPVYITSNPSGGLTIYTSDDQSHNLKIMRHTVNVNTSRAFELAVESVIDDNCVKNIVDGVRKGSLRSVGAKPEDENYSLGEYSIALGVGAAAPGYYSYAEGYNTTSNSTGSHAEGLGTIANNTATHAEGWSTAARGNASHAEGFNTIANHKSQHVFGEYNIEDPSTASSSSRGTYVEIVGNGTNDNAPSNARTLDWNGNEVLAGKLTIGVAPTNNMDVATKQYVDTAIGNAGGGLQNLVDGSATGSIRGIKSKAEGGGYHIAESAVTFGIDTRATGKGSFAHGNLTYARASFSHAEGTETEATSQSAHAEGYKTKAYGNGSHTEGEFAKADGQYSHAEGTSTTASGYASHAEGGSYSVASGEVSHAENEHTTASGKGSHAEGYYTKATGAYSHTEGGNTTANHKFQHVFGENNVADPSTADASVRGNYVEIVGNGTTGKTPSNARTLDWNGNEVLAGGLTVGAAGITIGSTTITESQLQALLAMLNS